MHELPPALSDMNSVIKYSRFDLAIFTKIVQYFGKIHLNIPPEMPVGESSDNARLAVSSPLQCLC